MIRIKKLKIKLSQQSYKFTTRKIHFSCQQKGAIKKNY